MALAAVGQSGGEPSAVELLRLPRRKLGSLTFDLIKASTRFILRLYWRINHLGKLETSGVDSDHLQENVAKFF